MSTILERETAVAQFMKDRHAEGVVIGHEYFWDLFGLVKPRGKNMSIEEAGRINMRFANRMAELVGNLLKLHKVDLQNAFSKGYRIVPHQERISTTVKDFRKTMHKELNRHVDRLVYIDGADNLSFNDQRQRDYVLQMAAAVKHSLRTMPRYPKD